MARPSSDIEARILETVDKQLRRVGASEITLEGISKETGCAKGLVHYHFRTRGELLAKATERLFQDREKQWRAALAAPNPETAIGQSWQLINAEVAGGFWRAWASVAFASDKMTVRTVSNSTEAFCGAVASAVDSLLRENGLIPSITASELGHLVGAAVQGFGMQLSNGMPPDRIEGAHAALWLGVLSLTRRRRV